MRYFQTGHVSAIYGGEFQIWRRMWPRNSLVGQNYVQEVYYIFTRAFIFTRKDAREGDFGGRTRPFRLKWIAGRRTNYLLETVLTSVGCSRAVVVRFTTLTSVFPITSAAKKQLRVFYYAVRETLNVILGRLHYCQQQQKVTSVAKEAKIFILDHLRFDISRLG